MAVALILLNSYDGLLDITHGCTGITVSNSKLHDHWKTSLVGHSDKNGDEDKKLTVTMALNHWINLNSRTPSFRFGHGHIYNNLFENTRDGINTRNGLSTQLEHLLSC
jgi:pectate lyase